MVGLSVTKPTTQLAEAKWIWGFSAVLKTRTCKASLESVVTLNTCLEGEHRGDFPQTGYLVASGLPCRKPSCNQNSFMRNKFVWLVSARLLCTGLISSTLFKTCIEFVFCEEDWTRTDSEVSSVAPVYTRYLGDDRWNKNRSLPWQLYMWWSGPFQESRRLAQFGKNLKKVG